MIRKTLLSTILMAFVLSAAYAEERSVFMSLSLRSSAFDQGQMIPAKFTCDGANVSPPLQWAGAPEGTKSFVLISDDPDAPGGDWVHWVIYDLPASVTILPENISPDAILSIGGVHGRTNFGNLGYGGPCPPRGIHRYFFKIYALDGKLNLSPGATKQQVLSAMEGHVLATCELMGEYQRKRN